jgi:hypothetical protein
MYYLLSAKMLLLGSLLLRANCIAGAPRIQPTWESCPLDVPNPAVAAECLTVDVPYDYDNPVDTRKLSSFVMRVFDPASLSVVPTQVYYLPGGNGVSGFPVCPLIQLQTCTDLCLSLAALGSQTQGPVINAARYRCCTGPRCQQCRDTRRHVSHRQARNREFVFHWMPPILRRDSQHLFGQFQCLPRVCIHKCK